MIQDQDSTKQTIVVVNPLTGELERDAFVYQPEKTMYCRTQLQLITTAGSPQIIMTGAQRGAFDEDTERVVFMGISYDPSWSIQYAKVSTSPGRSTSLYFDTEESALYVGVTMRADTE